MTHGDKRENIISFGDSWRQTNRFRAWTKKPKDYDHQPADPIRDLPRPQLDLKGSLKKSRSVFLD